jgi:NAD(P)H-hydrate epimerase
MREIDRRAIEEIGLPGAVLMENAGRAAAGELFARFGSLAPGPVLILAGKGNNGGDGYVIARSLLDHGWKVRTVALAAESAIGGDAALHLQALRRAGGEVRFAADADQFAAAVSADFRLIVDALLGTGLATEVGGLYAVAIEWINGAGRPVLAVDIPSGIDATTGAVLGRAVRANLTVTFAAAKVGHAVHPGAAHAGELVVADIGIPRRLLEEEGDRQLFFDGDEARALLAPRPVAGHKGTFGHLLVIAGSVGKSGAAALAAEGGLRAGAGLVTVACPQAIQEVLAGKVTEAMTVPLPDRDGGLVSEGWQALQVLWGGKSAVALGPGLGQREETFVLARRVVRECPLPLVIDADGLNALAGHAEILLERRAATVLTPHPGEMARLAGCDIAAVERDRLGNAREFARRYGIVLVLKGARSVTAFPDGRIRINASGNPGMASGGMGDVLTGLVGALIAQGLSVEDAAALGVFLHGHAADRLLPALGDAGMIATDLLRELPATRHELLTG